VVLAVVAQEAIRVQVMHQTEHLILVVVAVVVVKIQDLVEMAVPES
jgi:hypothetical protein